MRVLDIVWRELCANRRLGRFDRLVYLTAWSECPESIAELAVKSNINRSTVSRACVRLAQHGYLAMPRPGRARRPEALIPHKCQERMADRLRAEYDMSAYRGEFLMRKYLDLRVVSEDYVDNARPVEFTSPATGERLESDRLYADGVAFEFNGPQHYRLTEKFDDARSLKDRRTRDVLKKGLSLETHITLVIVTVSELHPAVLETLIPAHLKRRPIETEGPYYRALVDLYIAYAAVARTAKR